MSKTDKGYLGRIARYSVTAIASILLIAYIVYHINLSYGQSISTLTCEVSVLEEKLSLTGYVLRSETMLYADRDAGINYLIGDGERVARDGNIAATYQGQDVQQEIARIDAQIEILQKSDLGENIVLADTASIDAKLGDLILRMQKNIISGNLDYVLRQKNDMQILLNKRHILTNRLDGVGERIKKLQEEKQALLDANVANPSYLKAPVAGYFYADVDGYESVFSAQNAASLTLSGFHDMMKSDPTTDSPDSAQVAVGKLVTAFTWYLACPVDASVANLITTGSSYEMVFPYSDGECIKMTLERVVTEPNSDEAVLLLSTNTVVDGMNYLRSQPVELVVQSYRGYRIPVSAVRVREGEQGVYILQGSVVEYRQVKVLFESDGYFIAETKDIFDETQRNRLSLYDQIIVRGRDLYDGKIVD